MTISRFVLVLLLSVLCACGGGTGNVDIHGTTTVSFPISGGEIIGTSTTVCGSSDGDIDAVFVNGQMATTTDGFRTWRITLSLPTGENSISVLSQSQGQDVELQTLQVRNEDEYLGWMNRVSREENGVFVAYDGSSDTLVRIDRNNHHRQRLELNEMVQGVPVSYSIQELEFDPIENRAVLFDTYSGPRIIFADFDSGQVDSLPLPVTSMGAVKEIEFDVVGNRIFLRSHLAVATGGQPADHFYVIGIADQSLTLFSDETSPGGFAKPQLRMMTWEPTTGQLYAYLPIVNEIVTINLQTGSRDTLLSLSPVGISNFIGFDRMSVAANPLRFLLLPDQFTFSPPQAEPQLIDAATASVTSLPYSTLYFSVYDEVHAAASAGNLRLNFGNAILHLNADGTTTPDFQLGLSRHTFAGSKPRFDSLRRRLIAAAINELKSFDLVTAIVEGIPDPQAPVNVSRGYVGPGQSFSGECFYSEARDEIIFRDQSKLYLIPGAGGQRTELATVGNEIHGPVVFDDLNQCYWFASLVGTSPKVYAFTRLDLAGNVVSTSSTAMQPLAGLPVVAYDLRNSEVFIQGSATAGGGPQVSRYNLLTMTSTPLCFETDIGPTMSHTKAMEVAAEEGRLFMLTNAGLISVDLQSGVRSLVNDFNATLSSVRTFRGLTRDPESGLLFISAVGASTDSAAFGISGVILAFELGSNSVEVLGRF